MHIAESIDEFRVFRRKLRGTVGFVPTMGALHLGHTSLFQAARERADHLVVSIFVNPTQFDRAEDLSAYPTDTQGDLAKCEAAGAEIVFYPTPKMMYPNGRDQLTYVEVHDLDKNLCGATRPGHFRGVTTIVSKLFNIVQPDVAVFGQKDYQQLAIIRQMTADLNFDIEIVGGQTAREPDGLATSSRNYNIPDHLRPKARSMSRALGNVWAAYRDGVRSQDELLSLARRTIESAGLQIDYLQIVDALSLQVLPLDELPDANLVVAGAAFIGPVRIIDNVVLDQDLPQEIVIE